MKYSGESYRPAVMTDGIGYTEVSPDNRVELNANADDVNVNDNWDDNRNDNVRLASLGTPPLLNVRK